MFVFANEPRTKRNRGYVYQGVQALDVVDIIVLLYEVPGGGGGGGGDSHMEGTGMKNNILIVMLVLCHKNGKESSSECVVASCFKSL